MSAENLPTEKLKAGLEVMNFFMLNSSERKFNCSQKSAEKYAYIRFVFNLPNVVFILLINVKMFWDWSMIL